MFCPGLFMFNNRTFKPLFSICFEWLHIIYSYWFKHTVCLFIFKLFKKWSPNLFI